MIVPGIKLPKNMNLSEHGLCEIAACDAFNVDIQKFKENNRDRKREYVMVRQVVMNWAKYHTKESLADIGNIYGKDHATVLHAIKTVNNLVETNPVFRNKYENFIFKFFNILKEANIGDYICIYCQSKAVEVNIPVNPNNPSINGLFRHNNMPGYCFDCKKETIVIIESEYKNYYRNEEELEMETVSGQV